MDTNRDWLKINFEMGEAWWDDVVAMTLQAWNTILNAATLGLLVGGGIWLRYVVQQQLKTKDTTIEALKGVAEVKDAHILALSGNTAPAIAQAYAVMKTHAEDMTGAQLRLSEELKRLTAELRMKELIQPMRVLVSEAAGFSLHSTSCMTVSVPFCFLIRRNLLSHRSSRW